MPLIPLTVLAVAETTEGIEDRTETNVVNLQRVIYLTIMNALSSEEAVHKLLKVQTDKFQEVYNPSPCHHLLLITHPADWNDEAATAHGY